MKKTAIILLSCLCAFALFFGAVGCSNDKPNNEEKEDVFVESVEISDKTKQVILGETALLGVTYNEIEGETATWTSSNPQVASVDANGKVTALLVGDAVITVTYGSKNDSCELTVSLGGMIPQIELDNDLDETVSVYRGGTVDFSAHVSFNGKEYNDGVLNYSVSNNAIGSITNDGTFTAGNDKTATGTVSVSGTWREQTLFTVSYDISIITDQTVTLNGGELNNVLLYTLSSFGGETYSTVQQINEVTVLEDEQEVSDFTLKMADNSSSIATLTTETNGWSINAVGIGKTKLLVCYTGLDGEVEYEIEVEVTRPVADYENTIQLFSKKDGKFFDEETKTMASLDTVLTELNGIENGVQGENALTYADGKLLGITPSVVEGGEISVTLYGQNAGYNVKLVAYDFVIDELNDFTQIFSADENATEVSGKFILAQDILTPTAELTMAEGKYPTIFKGTFNGNGKMLSFTFVRASNAEYGLFGKDCQGVIKNVAFVNVTMDGCQAGLISSIANGTVEFENVYLNAQFSEKTSNYYMALMYNTYGFAKANKLIVDISEVPYSKFGYGALANHKLTGANNYVISNGPTFVEENRKIICYGLNEETILVNYEDYTTKHQVFVNKYANYSEMISANNDYSSFDEKLWDVSAGVPIWKT